jgi:exosortase
MTHGWLIPIISVHAIWRQRKQLKANTYKFSFVGILLLVLSVAFSQLGNIYSLLWLKQLSFIGLLWSLTFSLWGWDTAKTLVFPIWFLVFAISVPSMFEGIVLKLQSISTSMAFYTMNGLGFKTFQTGHALSSGIEGNPFCFEVADSCSGIRSLISLTALTAMLTWYSKSTLIRKWLLFACSIPIAITCNIIRVFSICFVAAIFGQQAALGYYHDYSGYVIAIIAIISIFHLGKIVNTVAGRAKVEGLGRAKVECTMMCRPCFYWGLTKSCPVLLARRKKRGLALCRLSPKGRR